MCFSSSLSGNGLKAAGFCTISGGMVEGTATMRRSNCKYEIFETAAGWCGIAWNDAGVVRFVLPVSSEESADRLLLRKMPEATRTEPDAETGATIASVRRYFAGETTEFSAVRVDLGPQDGFHSNVYERIRRLGWGETTTYGAVA